MDRAIMQTDNAPIQVNYDTIDNIMTFCVVYHEGEDTLFLRPEKPVPATSVDWQGEIWLRVNQKGEIVGLEVDEFESVFLKRHPEMAKAWREAKTLCHRRQRLKQADPALLILLNALKSIFRRTPHQAAFAMIP